MQEQDVKDLKSMLLYLRERFGEEVLEDSQRMFAFVCDLFPTMKPDGNVVRQMIDAGLLRELYKATQSGEEQDSFRVTMKTRSYLTDYLQLPQERVEYYVTALQGAYKPKPAPTVQPDAREQFTDEQRRILDEHSRILDEQRDKIERLEKAQSSYSRILDEQKRKIERLEAELQTLQSKLQAQPAAPPPPKPTGPIIQSGNTGDCIWTLNRNGVLTVSGSSYMRSYNSVDETPWWENRNMIRTIDIRPNVKSIGQYAFWECANLTEVNIPSSVLSIEYGAFRGCPKLTSVSVPAGARIESKAFEQYTKIIRRW